MADDDRKTGWCALAAALLCLMAIGYNVLQEPLFAPLEAQAERRRHFEQVIRPKGLVLHPAQYGKKPEPR